MGLYPLYLPLINPLLKKQLKLLLLWSDIIIPIFGYGKQIKSSTAVESMINKIKMPFLKILIFQRIYKHLLNDA